MQTRNLTKILVVEDEPLIRMDLADTLRELGFFVFEASNAADSELKPAGIPINYRPPFRFEAGHDSNQLSAVFRL